MLPAPIPVVSSHDGIDDEDECPVCLEPLSFSFRLPGEKPHIVPECGHALHEVLSSFLTPPLRILTFPRLASVQYMAHHQAVVIPYKENQIWASAVYVDVP